MFIELNLSPNLSLKVVFLFQSFLVITVAFLESKRLAVRHPKIYLKIDLYQFKNGNFNGIYQFPAVFSVHLQIFIKFRM